MLEQYEEKLKSGYYRVRKTWEDEESQIGQYRLLNSAVKKADENPGYSVFAPNGIAIYPEDEETAETATISEGTEEITLDAPEPTQDEQEDTGTEGGEEVVASEEEAAESDSDTSEEVSAETEEDILSEEDIAAQTEALGEDEYPNDGNTEPVLYAKASTLLNVRAGNSLDAKKVALIRKGEIAEVLEVCENGWYRIKCDKAECGYAYVSNALGTYFSTGKSLYTVQPADSLWKIAEKELGSGTKYTAIKTANGLTSNVIRVGMVLLIS